MKIVSNTGFGRLVISGLDVLSNFDSIPSINGTGSITLIKRDANKGIVGEVDVGTGRQYDELDVHTVNKLQTTRE